MEAQLWISLGRIHLGTPSMSLGFGFGECTGLVKSGSGAGRVMVLVGEVKAMALSGMGTVTDVTHKLTSTYVGMSKPCCSSWSCTSLSYMKLLPGTPGNRVSYSVKLPTSYMVYASLDFGLIRGP